MLTHIKAEGGATFAQDNSAEVNGMPLLTRAGVVFTDGNARTTGTKFLQYTGIDDLSALDAAAINTTNTPASR